MKVLNLYERIYLIKFNFRGQNTANNVKYNVGTIENRYASSISHQHKCAQRTVFVITLYTNLCIFNKTSSFSSFCIHTLKVKTKQIKNNKIP